MPSPPKRKIFISYSHRDRPWLERLQVHLRPLERAGLLDRWDDTRIRAGDRWREEIAQGLSQADVAVLLVSADFLASDFISSEELPALLAAEQERGLVILSVILKPCRLSGTPLAELQAIHPMHKPLMQMDEAEQENVWVKLAEEIETHIQQVAREEQTAATAAPPRSVWTVPFEANPFFTGREDLLCALREQLISRGRAAVCGLGGIGKTQLAVCYAYRHRDSYSHVLWTRASTSHDLLTGFSELARLLGLPEAREAEQKRAIDATRAWLEEHNDWLLIFDNADQPELAKEFRPRNVSGHLLVTSRNRSVQQLGIPEPVSVNEMKPEEAIEFLLRRTGRKPGDPREDKAAEELARELGYLPLALEQASAYIAANQSRFQDYLRGYRTRRLAVLTAPVAGEYPDSVSTTWALNFREVAQIPEAADLLRVSAFLDPDAIPLELIARGASELGPALSAALADVMEDPLVLDETLEPLYRYSLVRRDVASRTYSILPIMQAVLLDGLEPDIQRQWAERAVRAVKRTFPTPDYEHWAACERLIPHTQACAKLIAKYNFDFPEAGYLLLDAAIYLRRRARFAEAASLQQQLLALRERTLGPDHTSVAETLVNLAKLYRQQGRYEEAEPLLQRAVAIREKTDGQQDPEVGRILNTLAALYRNTGRFEEAEPLARRALEIEEANPDRDRREIAKALTNLATILRSRQKYEESEQLLRRSIKMEEEMLGPEHHGLASSLTMLAELCRIGGRLAEAESLLQRALKLDEDTLGLEHPNVAWSLTGLAEVLFEQGRSEEAESLYKRALDLRMKALGSDHPMVRETQQRYEALMGSRSEK
jgi:tetratricopeptide (TPR) repeat protein